MFDAWREHRRQGNALDRRDAAQAPQRHGPVGQQLEVRVIAEEDDFGDEFTPELRAQEARLRETAAANARG